MTQRTLAVLGCFVSIGALLALFLINPSPSTDWASIETRLVTLVQTERNEVYDQISNFVPRLSDQVNEEVVLAPSDDTRTQIRDLVSEMQASTDGSGDAFRMVGLVVSVLSLLLFAALLMMSGRQPQRVTPEKVLVGKSHNDDVLGELALVLWLAEEKGESLDNRYLMLVSQDVLRRVERAFQLQRIAPFGAPIPYDPRFHELTDRANPGEKVFVHRPGWKIGTEVLLFPEVSRKAPRLNAAQRSS
jgi:hypothetical protein